MYINCFLVLMIISQNIPPPTKAKPYFTKIHRLNSERDFDDIVDWTALKNIDNQEQEQKTNSPSIKVRSITSEATDTSSISSERNEKINSSPSAIAKDEATVVTEKVEISEMPSPASNEEIKTNSKRLDVEEFDESATETEDNMEFGEGISNMYKNAKHKFKKKKKKCKNCFNELEDDVSLKLDSLEDGYRDKVKYILPYRRSAPLCLLNEGTSKAYLQQSALPAVQPILLNSQQPVYIQEFPMENEASIYEVQWAKPSSISSNALRKRREIDVDLLQKQGFPREKLSEVQKDLATMIRAVKGDFLRQNNVTFLPILFSPHCTGNQISAEMQDSSDLGHLNLQKMDTWKMPQRVEEEWPKPCGCPQPIPKECIPFKGDKINTTGIRHLTIILLANNSLSFVVPGMRQEGEFNQKSFARHCPCQSFYPPFNSKLHYIPYSRKMHPFKRNVIDNLKQYLQDAFNFIDIRRVLTEDEIHDRRSREIFEGCKKDVIPGILIYPNKYGTVIPKYTREASLPDRSINPFGFYSFSNCANTYPKFKRSLDMGGPKMERDASAVEENVIKSENTEVELEKEIEKGVKMDKEVVEALNEGSSNIAESSMDQLKKDEEYLEKENQEMLHNEEILESPDTSDSEVESTEQTCVFTEPLITEEVELLSPAKDSPIEGMAGQPDIESVGKLEDMTGPEVYEQETAGEALTECPECGSKEPLCPHPPHLGHGKNVESSHGAKSKKSKTITGLEDEMHGLIAISKSKLTNHDRQKVAVEASTRNPTRKIHRKLKSRKDRSCRFHGRSRRNLKSTNVSGGCQETTASKELEVRNALPEVTEPVKVTPKKTTSPFAFSEEVEDVSQVLFTSKTEQERIESSEGDEVKGESTNGEIQKTSEAGIFHKCSEDSGTTGVPAGISNYVQSEVRDENDETVTETLTRLLRDLTLVNRLQNFLNNAEENEYDEEGEFEKRTKRESTGRKLFSMEVHQMAKESNGPFQKFRKRTSRRRSGKNFRFSRGIDRRRRIVPDVEANAEENLETYNDMEEGISEKKRWKDYVGDYMEWIPNFKPFLETNYQNYQF